MRSSNYLQASLAEVCAVLQIAHCTICSCLPSQDLCGIMCTACFDSWCGLFASKRPLTTSKPWWNRAAVNGFGSPCASNRISSNVCIIICTRGRAICFWVGRAAKVYMKFIPPDTTSVRNSSRTTPESTKTTKITWSSIVPCVIIMDLI